MGRQGSWGGQEATAEPATPRQARVLHHNPNPCHPSHRVAALYGATTGVASWRACMRRRRDSVGSDGGAGGGGDVLAASLAVSYSACQLMTHFFRQYLLYVTFEVGGDRGHAD